MFQFVFNLFVIRKYLGVESICDGAATLATDRFKAQAIAAAFLERDGNRLAKGNAPKSMD